MFLCKIPVLVQDLLPDLWKWPRTWSRLGWTLQEWTSLMAHMKWVWSSQEIIFCACSIYFTPQSQMVMITTGDLPVAVKATAPALTSLIKCVQKCNVFESLNPDRAAQQWFLSPSESDSVDLPFAVAATSVVLLLRPVCGCNLSYELVCSSPQCRCCGVTCDLAMQTTSRPTLWSTLYWPLAFKSHASLPFSTVTWAGEPSNLSSAVVWTHTVDL